MNRHDTLQHNNQEIIQIINTGIKKTIKALTFKIGYKSTTNATTILCTQKDTRCKKRLLLPEPFRFYVRKSFRWILSKNIYLCNI